MLISSSDALLLIIDIQERLAPATEDHSSVVSRAAILGRAAVELSVPVLITEQYPRGLGPTLAAVTEAAPGATVLEKTEFCCARSAAIAEAVAAAGKKQLVLAGMETHICVLQSALGFKALGHDVFVVADATGSRTGQSRQLGLDRMRQSGIVVANSEMVIFEWLERAGTDAFKRIQPLIR